MSKTQFNNDWQSLIAKPEAQTGKKKFEDDKPDPFYQKREDTYYSLFPPRKDEGSEQRYAFALVPAANGTAFAMEEVMTIKRWRFTSPKTGIHYFENLKLPMNPNSIFDMSILDKASDPNSLTDEDKLTINSIKKHSDLVQRYKNLQYCKVDKVNFGYVQGKAGLHNQRLKKQVLTGFFGVWTKWKGAPNTKREFNIKFISSGYGAFQDKFRSLLSTTAETHQELQPTWYEDYFSHIGGVKGVIDVEMGSMAVGGKGATIKLVKLGKDPIDDKGVGVTGPINEKDIKFPAGKENELSHLHYFMGFKSDEDIWQDDYVERFEEAISQLEAHVKERELEVATSGTSTPSADNSTAPKAETPANESKDPKGDEPF